MIITQGDGKTRFGRFVQIDLSDDELLTAIEVFLVAHAVNVLGPRTVTVNGERCKGAKVYVDPSGSVLANGIKLK